MKKGEKLLKVFLYIVLVVLGVLVGIALSHYKTLPLTEEINLIDAAALIVTIFLAVYIPAVLDRQLQTMRDRKNILEDRITDYQSLVRRINMLIQANLKRSLEEQLTIRNLLDVSGHRLDTIASLIKNSGLDSSLNRDMIQIKKINDEHKNLLWNEIEANTEQTSSEQAIREQEEILYNKLDEVTSLLIFKINNTN